jgi:hypothetical protein
MLKKLSRFRQSVLRSRVQLLVSNIMPQVTERSGVNLKGAYNSWHGTLSTNTDNETYNKICHLKQFIDEPLEKVGSMEVSKVFELMEFFMEKVNSNLTEIRKDYWEIAQDEQMLGYQLKDKRFVSEIIVQCLILCHSFTKPANQTQKTSFNLNEGDLLKMKLCQSKLSMQLEKLNKNLHQGLDKILHQENKWAEWKDAQCPSFEKAPSMEDPLPIEYKTFSTKQSNGKGKHTSLFEENEYDPDLQKYLNKVYIDLDPEEDIEDEYKSKHDQVFSWRMLRLVSQTNLKTFQKIYDGDIEKIAIELRPKNSEEMADEPATDTMESDIREGIEETRPFEDKDKEIYIEIEYTSDKSIIEDENMHTDQEGGVKENYIQDEEMKEEGEIINIGDKSGEEMESEEEVGEEGLRESVVEVEQKQGIHEINEQKGNVEEKEEDVAEKTEVICENTVVKEESGGIIEEIEVKEQVISESRPETIKSPEAKLDEKLKQSSSRMEDRRSKDHKEAQEKREERKKPSRQSEVKDSYYSKEDERLRRDSQRNSDQRESPSRRDRDEPKFKDYRDSHKRDELKSRDTQQRREDRSKDFRREEYKKEEKRSNYSRAEESKRDFRDNREFFHRRDDRGYKDQHRKEDRRDRDFPKKRGPFSMDDTPEKRLRRRSH